MVDCTKGKLFIYLLIIFVLSACSSSDAFIMFPETINLASETKTVENVYMRYPFRICKDDSCLYVMDLHSTDFYCHQFHYPSMTYRQSFAKRGEAPDQFLDAENIRFSEANNIWILDANKKKVTEFCGNTKDIIYNVNLSDALVRVLDFDLYNDSVFIIPDYTGKSRFCLVGLDGNIIKGRYAIPTGRKDKTVSGTALAQGWRSFIDYNPTNGIMAMATQLGQVIDLYDLKADTLINVVSGRKGEPEFSIAGGYAIPNGIMGYSDVYVGESNVYAIFWGHSFDDIRKDKVKTEGGCYIHVFDLKGNPVRQYVLDRYITGFCVDEQNKKIIALDVNSDQPIIEYSYL